MALDLDAYEYRVVTVLLSFRWEAGSEIFPRISVIAQKARCVERTVQRVIARLEAKGYLLVEERYRDDGGQTSNRYILAGDLATAVAGVDQLREQRGVTATASPRMTRNGHQEERPKKQYKPAGQTKSTLRPPTTFGGYLSGPYGQYIHH